MFINSLLMPGFWWRKSKCHANAEHLQYVKPALFYSNLLFLLFFYPLTYSPIFRRHRSYDSITITSPPRSNFRCPKGCISRLKFCTTDSKTQQINPPQRIRRILIKIPSIVQPNRFQHNKPTDPRVVVAEKRTY